MSRQPVPTVIYGPFSHLPETLAAWFPALSDIEAAQAAQQPQPGPATPTRTWQGGEAA